MSSDSRTPTVVVRVWDLPVRVFHWLLVALVGFSWWSGEQGGLTLKYHMWCGYSILTLLLFRAAWGVLGSETARFRSFFYGPRRVLDSIAELRSANPLPYTSHNPLGGWMVVALLLSLFIQVSTGLFANDDLFNEGPLYAHVGKATSDTLTAIHHLNFAVLSALIGIHVLAIAYHRLHKGERLVSAMFSGYKRLPGGVRQPAEVSPWRALVLIAVAAAIVAAVVNY